MWKKWKIWDNVYKKSMLRAFARSRAKKKSKQILESIFYGGKKQFFRAKNLSVNT